MERLVTVTTGIRKLNRSVGALAISLLTVLIFAPTAEAKAKCAGKPATIVGGKGRDVIKAPKRGRQVVVALGGNDKIVTHGSDDTVCAGPGDDEISTAGNKDRVFAGPGDDVVDSGPGSDGIDLGPGDDMVFGGGGGEMVRGGSGADLLFGEQQDDRLFGDTGNDLMIGSQGSDFLRGGAGSDWLRGDTEGDRFRGDAGEDWLSFATATPPGYANIGTGVQLGASLSGGVSKVTGDGDGEDFATVEHIVGSAFRDSLGAPTSGQGSATGIADAGDECLGFATATCGQDPRTGDEAVALVEPSPRDPGLILLGATGTDNWAITPGANGTTITGTALKAGPGCSAEGPGRVVCATPSNLGYLVAYGSGGADQIRLAGAAPRGVVVKIDGGEGPDSLQGGPGDELIFSGGSTTRLPSATWRDELDGGGGDDVVAIRDELRAPAPGGGDVLRGGAGADQMVVESVCNLSLMSGGSGGPDIAGFAPSSDGGIRAVLGGTVSKLFEQAPVCPSARMFADLEILEGTAVNDILIGSKGPDALILGKDGDDRLLGRGGADRLRGEGDNDVMVGGGGPDILEARDGAHDVRIDCGPGGLRATRDKQDPKPRGCR
jgi:Ca2+-binding RTX toxin-like protein